MSYLDKTKRDGRGPLGCLLVVVGIPLLIYSAQSITFNVAEARVERLCKAERLRIHSLPLYERYLAESRAHRALPLEQQRGYMPTAGRYLVLSRASDLWPFGYVRRIERLVMEGDRKIYAVSDYTLSVGPLANFGSSGSGIIRACDDLEAHTASFAAGAGVQCDSVQDRRCEAWRD